MQTEKECKKYSLQKALFTLRAILLPQVDEAKYFHFFPPLILEFMVEGKLTARFQIILPFKTSNTFPIIGFTQFLRATYWQLSKLIEFAHSFCVQHVCKNVIQ